MNPFARTRWMVVGVILFGWLYLLAPRGWTQDTGSITGNLIEGWDGRPLAGVAVTVRGTTLATTSDAQGRFQLGGLPVGDHVVRFSRAGYATASVSDVRVLPGQSTTVNGTLRPEFYEMEEYEVTAEVFRNRPSRFFRNVRTAVPFLKPSVPSSSSGSVFPTPRIS
jgi:hypothetical protein